MNYSLDINVRCLQGLKIKNMLFNKRVYALVSVVGSCRSIQKTPYGKFEAEVHKTKTWKWDYPMRFHVQESMVQENRLMVVIRLRRNIGCFCRDKDIGEVYIPIKQLFYTINGLDNSGTYQVHSPSGKLKGYLTLWYTFHEYCSSRSASDENLFNNLRSSVLASSSSSSARSSEEVARRYRVLSSAPSYYQYRVLPSAPPL
ncbi:hypothetical protein FNV43_RR04963 [Rhamnella rubrinervis]|uniref:C2 domain-containing protein n=1 Tax=Rhamnella rubrinervis TaxID=2594499 RepID=A0A8K0HMT9_9ROSA|nr:hypothetical protein FNV43_RR04963 [Rhamnella rubrinervis]